MRKYVWKSAGYLHSILVLMAILTPVYGIGLLTEGEVLYGIYWLGLWIAVPVVTAGVAIHKCKRVTAYFLLGLLASAGMLLAVWGIGRQVLASPILYLLMGVMLAEALAVVLDHLRVRLALARARKDGSIHDTAWIPPRSVFERPSVGGFFAFGLVYGLGILIASRVICNVALVEGLAYFFLYLLYHYVSVTEGYFRLQHHVKHIPTRRIYGITGSVLGILAVLLAAAAAVSLLMIPQRKYFDMRSLSLGGGELVMEDLVQMTPPQMSGMEELLGEDYVEPQPMPQWLDGLFRGLALLLLVAVCGLALRGIWQYLRIFREGEEENGDLVEELRDVEEQEERLPAFREREPLSERERIRRMYRKTIRRYRKERPKVSETPLEIEQAAGIDRLEEIQRLHRQYEEARYGE